MSDRDFASILLPIIGILWVVFTILLFSVESEDNYLKELEGAYTIYCLEEDCPTKSGEHIVDLNAIYKDGIPEKLKAMKKEGYTFIQVNRKNNEKNADIKRVPLIDGILIQDVKINGNEISWSRSEEKENYGQKLYVKLNEQWVYVQKLDTDGFSFYDKEKEYGISLYSTSPFEEDTSAIQEISVKQ